MEGRYVAYSVTPARQEGGKDFWTRIGMGFPGKSDSMTIQLNALPTNAKIVLVPEDRETETEQPKEPPKAPATNGKGFTKRR